MTSIFNNQHSKVDCLDPALEIAHFAQYFENIKIQLTFFFSLFTHFLPVICPK